MYERAVVSQELVESVVARKALLLLPSINIDTYSVVYPKLASRLQIGEGVARKGVRTTTIKPHPCSNIYTTYFW